MPKRTVNCPVCRQPFIAEIDQLFDVGQDPTAKQKLLSGAFNIATCPNCGFHGQISVPIVYHDPNKELLLNFMPTEINISRDEQERIIGSMINQIMNNLPQEMRKGYFLNPQSVLTMQGLVERILETDGITREMIQAQQDRLTLIQKFLDITDESALEKALLEEDERIDVNFLAIIQQLHGAATSSGDQETATRLDELKQKILSITAIGREIQTQSHEVEAAIADLKKVGKDLDRDKLLDLVIKAPNEIRLQVLVGLTRPIMDYVFFQLLSERIDRARGDGRTRLVDLRSRLLEMTETVDKQVAEISQEKRALLKNIIEASDVKDAMMSNIGEVDEFFMNELALQLDNARKQGDLVEIEKLQKVLDFIKEASEPPPELALIEELIEAPDDHTRQKIIEENQGSITQEFLNLLTNIVVQAQSSGDIELAERAMAVNRQVLRFSMTRNIN